MDILKLVTRKLWKFVEQYFCDVILWTNDVANIVHCFFLLKIVKLFCLIIDDTKDAKQIREIFVRGLKANFYGKYEQLNKTYSVQENHDV